MRGGFASHFEAGGEKPGGTGPFGQFDPHHHGVARANHLAEFDVIDSGRDGNLARHLDLLSLGRDQQGSRLHRHFAEDHPGEHRLTGIVPPEQVERGLEALPCRQGAGVVIVHLIDPQKGIAVRNQRLDFRTIEQRHGDGSGGLFQRV